MSTGLGIQKYNNIDFKMLFKPINDKFSPVISNVINEYWQENLTTKLYFVSPNPKFFVYGTKFFVTQAQIQKIVCDMRLSAELCEMLLEKSLGQKNSRFNISEISVLEGEILAKFSALLFEKFRDIFPSKEELKKMIEEEVDFEEKINLGFSIYCEGNNFEAGRFILTCPLNLLKNISPLTLNENSINVSCFTKSKGIVDILIGKTKLSLDDMKQLDIEDIVLLENSNIKRMKIIYPAKLDINVNPDPRLFVNDMQEDNNEPSKEDIMSNSMENIWDNVQVDVLAKFSKVKLSLGELRRMSEGSVVELDNVYDNKVVLEVENKVVAKGELVIIGDKYGVCISEINANPEEAEENISENNSDVESTDENEISDDFDVNDFEIDGR